MIDRFICFVAHVINKRSDDDDDDDDDDLQTTLSVS